MALPLADPRQEPISARDARAAMAAILIVAGLLRAWNLQGQSLSMDEIAEASIARCRPMDIAAYADGFPPLFHLTLAAWSRVAPSPESGRWISVLAGVATVYAVGRWARGLLGVGAGLVAAALVAISPLHVYLSQEMRAYSLYLCLVAFALMFFFDALRDDRRRDWLGFVLTMAAGVYTHYYAAAAGLVMGLAFIGRRRPFRELRRGLVSFTALFFICLPLALFLVPNDVKYQGTYDDKPTFAMTLAHTAYALWAGFSLGPSLRELHSTPLRHAATLIAPWAALIAVAGGSLLWFGWRELRRRPNGRAVIFLALASAPIIGVLGNAAGVGFKVQYWSWIVFPLIVWLAAGVVGGWQGRTRSIAALAAAALVALQLTAVFNRLQSPRYANEDIRAAAEHLTAHATPNANIFIAADYLAPSARYYLNGPRALDNWLPHMPRDNAAAAPAADDRSHAWTVIPLTADGLLHEGLIDRAAPRLSFDAALASGREFWLIYSRPFHGDPDRALLNRLHAAGAATPAATFPGVDLYRVPPK